MKPISSRRSIQFPRRPARFRPCLLCLEDRLLLSVYTVDRLTDLGQGSGAAGDLRYCITNAASGDDITFNVTGTINLTRPLPILSHNLTIMGPGADSLTVERGNTEAFSVFSVAAGAVVGMSGLTIANGIGLQGGGGVLNNGTLTVGDTVFLNNTATVSGSGGIGGGAIDNAGTLTVSGCTFSGNSATNSSSGSLGGAIENARGSMAAVSGSTFTGNSAGSSGGFGSASGGGISNAGTLSVSASIFAGNSANGGSGGGISNDGTLNVSGSTFSGNSAFAGGGIGNFDVTADVSDCTFSGNSAGLGGAIYNDEGSSSNGQLTVSSSTVSGNSASGGAGGGIYNTYEGFSSNGRLTIRDSAVSGNSVSGGGFGGSAGGGIYNVGTLNVSNSTLSGNHANGSDGGGGGGIYGGGTVDLTSSTLAGNSASDGGGLYVQSGVTVRPRNTILAGNAAARGPDFFGHVTSQGHNLIQHPDSNGSGFDSTDLLTLDPLLDPNGLYCNGGSTKTIALLSGSPAIDAGDNTGAPMWDQRGPGFSRIVNGTIDIGAFEVQNSQAASFQVDAPATVIAGTPFTITVTALDATGQVAAGYTGTVSFSTSDQDPGVVLPADYTFTLADGGVHTFSDTGLGETTLITRGYQSLTVTDTADGSILGSATLKVKHTRHHDGGGPGVSAGHDPATADRFFAALVPEDVGWWAASPHHRRREARGLWGLDGVD